MTAGAACLPSRESIEAARRVAKIADPVAECARRWPGFTFSVARLGVRGGKRFTQIEARWTRCGAAHGLRDELPVDASLADIADAKTRIAVCALTNDERRRTSQ